MIFELLVLLTAFGVSLGLISAIANDRWILIAGGGVFILCSMMILPSGVEMDVGMEANENESEISTPQTRLNNVTYREREIYENIDIRYDQDMSRYISVLYAGIGLFFILRGVAGRGGPSAMPW